VIFVDVDPSDPGDPDVPDDLPLANNRISGTSGGSAFESVTFYNVANVTIDTGSNDTLTSADDTITIDTDGLVASGLESFVVLTRGGNDVVLFAGDTVSLHLPWRILSIDTGSGEDLIVFSDDPGSASVTVDGGDGIDRLDCTACTNGAEIVSIANIEQIQLGAGGLSAAAMTVDDGTLDLGDVSQSLEFTIDSAGFVSVTDGLNTLGGIEGITTLLGGSGIDSLVGPESGAAWTVAGDGSGDVAGVTFAGIETLSGGTGMDTLDFSGVSADVSITVNASGALSVSDAAGTTNPISSIENVIGSAGVTHFLFEDGAALQGTIEGSRTILDYGAYSSAVSVALAAGTATGTQGVINVVGVVGGSGVDTLSGPAEHSTWMITGIDAGTVGPTVFSGIENLSGNGDNEDAFVLGPDGNISGSIDGGAPGYDSLMIQAQNIDTVVVIPGPTGAGTADYDGRTIQYSGLETFVDASDSNVLVNGTVLADNLVLEGDPQLGSMRIVSTLYQFLLPDGSTSDSLSFANPAASLTVDLKAGADSLRLGQFDTGFSASLFIAAAAGEDQLIGPDAAAAWEIN
jgi:hypothetical protein